MVLDPNPQPCARPYPFSRLSLPLLARAGQCPSVPPVMYFFCAEETETWKTTEECPLASPPYDTLLFLRAAHNPSGVRIPNAHTALLPAPRFDRVVPKTELAQRLKLDEAGPDPPNKFPWAMYTPDGQRKISSLDDAITSRLVFIFKGEKGTDVCAWRKNRPVVTVRSWRFSRECALIRQRLDESGA